MALVTRNVQKNYLKFGNHAISTSQTGAPLDDY